MTPSDHTTAAALDRISRAMTGAELYGHRDRMPHQVPGRATMHFVDRRNGGNLPRRDLLDASPPLIFVAFMACVVLFVAFDWIVQLYLF